MNSHSVALIVCKGLNMVYKPFRPYGPPPPATAFGQVPLLREEKLLRINSADSGKTKAKTKVAE
ncbi:hypothetical protein DDV96_08510 [Marixanthomonas spongiae]|uniref:Uncharacterized protein n=1 Tax=Marixanthomonas spongiae TaxID=2174845 RepID=A0A2U0I0C9_9FLAO|nr:hypothetical protein DDV96_08510 [Marixanthomonas spongiae]